MAGEHAFDIEKLFSESYNSLCYFATQYISEPRTAEDLVQDAFLQLYKVKDNITDVRSAKSYLYTSVRNAALNLIRHQKVQEKFISQHKTGQNEDQTIHDLITAEVVGAIHRAIELLPDRCKEIFKLGYFEELNNAEIASHLGISVNTVKTQKKRALQLLRIKLKDFDLVLATVLLFVHDMNIFF